MKNYSNVFSHWALLPFYGLCALLPILVKPIAAESATYYVASTGDDTNPGTLTLPFKHIDQAVRMLQPGDTMYIREGLYTERIDLGGTNNKSGAPGQYITIAGYPGELVTLQYRDPVDNSHGPIKARGNRGYFIFENLVLDGLNDTKGSGWQIRDGNHHFVLRNIEIKNFQTTGLSIRGDEIQVINCKIHDQQLFPGSGRFYGIYPVFGSNILLEGNEIYNNPGGGIHAYTGPFTNLVIRNNKVHHNNYLDTSPVEGIMVFQKNRLTPITGVKIYNNLVYLNGVNQPDPARSGGIRVSNGVSGAKIWNNTVYGNKGWGINIQDGLGGPPSATVVQNNIVFGNTSGQIIDAGSVSTLNHNLTTDPRFVKPETFDFRLQQHSPGIDGGIDLPEVKTDCRNVRRPNGRTHDIGAYEDGSDINSVSPPKDLAVR